MTVVTHREPWRPIDVRLLWRYRELIGFLVWRDIKIRYKQTELGVLWAVVQPLLTTGVFALIFALLLGRGREPGAAGVPYVLSTFCAMLPWQLFSEAMIRASNSLVDGRELVTKVYFPRAAMPIAASMVSLIDFGVRLLLMFILMACFRMVPPAAVWTLPLWLALALTASIAVALWLSALSAIYHDFRYALPFLNQLGFYASPVIYATARLTASLPAWAKSVYALNPMVGVIEGFRWALLGTDAPLWPVLWPSAAAIAVLLVGGMFFFRRMDRVMVDVI